MLRFVAVICTSLFLSVGSAWSASPPDFTLRTGQDLLDLCGSSPQDEFHEQAKLACYGYLEGVAQFYDEAVRERRIRRIYCDPSEVTRSQAAQAIAMWAKRNPDYLNRSPLEVTLRAAEEIWPCEKR